MNACTQSYVPAVHACYANWQQNLDWFESKNFSKLTKNCDICNLWHCSEVWSINYSIASCTVVLTLILFCYWWYSQCGCVHSLNPITTHHSINSPPLISDGTTSHSSTWESGCCILRYNYWLRVHCDGSSHYIGNTMLLNCIAYAATYMHIQVTCITFDLKCIQCQLHDDI